MPDRRPGPAAARDERQEHAQQTAGRRGEDRDARVGQREGQRDRPERPERHRRRVATRARGEADEGQREADDRAEDQEQPAVGRGGEQRAADLDRRRRVDGERRDDGRDQSDEPDRRGDAGPPPAEQRDAAGTDGDDQVQDEGHRLVHRGRRHRGNASGDQIGIESGEPAVRAGPGIGRSPDGRGAGRGSALSAKPVGTVVPCGDGQDGDRAAEADDEDGRDDLGERRRRAVESDRRRAGLPASAGAARCRCAARRGRSRAGRRRGPPGRSRPPGPRPARARPPRGRAGRTRRPPQRRPGRASATQPMDDPPVSASPSRTAIQSR